MSVPARTTPPRPHPTPPRPRRTRVDRATTIWMVIAVVLLVYTGAFGGSLPRQWWLTVHLVTLGVITNAILQWSWYFTKSLLRLKADSPHATTHQGIRVVLFNLALAGLIAAMITANVPGAMAATSAIGAVIIWHLVAMILARRTGLGARFAVIIRYYVAAAAALLVGVIYGTVTVIPLLSPRSPAILVEAQGNLTVAHFLINGLGFAGLTIAGTLVTLGPTALRTRMDQGAVPSAVQALPFLTASVLGAALAATFGALPLAGVFTLTYTMALFWGVGVSLARAARAKGLRDYAAWAFTLGTLWTFAGLLWLSAALLTSTQGPVASNAFRESLHPIITTIGVAGILQILAGALSYLLPVVTGGGPAAVRQGIAVVERGGPLRLAARNAALLVAVLITAEPGQQAGSAAGVAAAPFIAIVGATYLLDLAALAGAGVAQAKLKRARHQTEEVETP